ncbi:tRNA lysidine(34) synthetase TilS [Chitinophaga defluvii]|uniref:tRNA(Ile)-lysidine synthase n=1 Tax=Chitinophaga defluvii TaxID=3163343 RepID=A0ABV2T416_9BACT
MQQTILTSFKSYVSQEQLFDTSQPILLAVSGGIDSVVLTHLFSKADFSFAIAHCNFQLRGEESLRDEHFVQQLALRYQVPFYTVRFDTHDYTTAHKVSVQVAARELRYKWLEEIRQQQGYHFIATAHHMQDNVETVLMNFCKGTGIAGMHGILPRQGHIIRPLLFTQKEVLLDYGKAEQLDYVEDSSNTTDKYTRNFFRHQVIPQIQSAFPGAVTNMAGTIHRLKEAEILYQQAVVVHKKRLLVKKDNTWMIPVLKLQKTIPLQTIAYEIFREFSCSPSQTEQVLALLGSESGRFVETATHRIIRNRQWLLITALEEEDAPVVVIEKGQSQVKCKEGQLQLRAVTLPHISASLNIACLDAKQVQYPLILRRWKQGDYFYPLGMIRKKKLSRFFIDQKLSLPQKEKVWVLESGKRIVWVVGMRIDNRFKITDSTKEMLLLEWTALP